MNEVIMNDFLIINKKRGKKSLIFQKDIIDF